MAQKWRQNDHFLGIFSSLSEVFGILQILVRSMRASINKWGVFWIFTQIFCANVGTGSEIFDDDSWNVWNRRVASSLIWGWQPCLQKYFFLRRNSYVIFFRLLRFYAKSRVGSEGVTGLKTRGRPPRLDDKYTSEVLLSITM